MSLGSFYPMPPSVRQRIASDRAAWAALTAGTHKPEPDTAQAKGDRLVIDSDADRLYSDRMESHDSGEDTFGRGGASFRNSGEGVPTGSLRDAPGKAALHRLLDRESERLSFLRRVQYVDPRERRT